MKTINAVTTPNTFRAMALADRRQCTRMDTAGIKRQERRKSRRVLDAEVKASGYQGVHRDSLFAMPVFEKKSVLTREPEFFLFPVIVPTQFKAVTVTRKRHLQRPTVETLRVAVA